MVEAPARLAWKTRRAGAAWLEMRIGYSAAPAGHLLVRLPVAGCAEPTDVERRRVVVMVAVKRPLLLTDFAVGRAHDLAGQHRSPHDRAISHLLRLLCLRTPLIFGHLLPREGGLVRCTHCHPVRQKRALSIVFRNLRAAFLVSGADSCFVALDAAGLHARIELRVGRMTHATLSHQRHSALNGMLSSSAAPVEPPACAAGVDGGSVTAGFPAGAGTVRGPSMSTGRSAHATISNTGL